MSVAPAPQRDQGLVRMQEWPLRSYRQLRAVPASVRSARLHAQNILREWGLEALADTVELLVSEIATNAVRASASIADQPREAGRGPARSRMRLWLTSDGQRVLIQVWDSDLRHPVCQDAGLDAEAGRGLLLVETLSAQWGCCTPGEPGGKIVWALCGP